MHVQAAAASKRAVEEKAAFGTFASDGGKTYTYREQKGGTYGSYKVVSVALDGSKTREELLELRPQPRRSVAEPSLVGRYNCLRHQWHS